MKRYIVWTAVLIFICFTRAEALDVSARSAILMDGDSGIVLYEKNADDPSLIASTTKIMTAMVVIEQCNLSDVVEIPAAAVGIEGSSMYLKAGEQLTVEQLLYGLMLSSGNDAAVALALHTSGSIEAFADVMNQTAEALGLQNAHFANPNGLDSEDNYATARDLAMLTMAAMRNEAFHQIVSTRYYDCPGHPLTNHNKLLWQYDGAVGVKTGFTKQAGRLLVGCAERNGRRLISVTIHAPDDWRDHASMLDYGFSCYEEKQLLAAGQTLGEIAVISGDKMSLPLEAVSSVSGYVLAQEGISYQITAPFFVYAPIQRGEVVGSVKVYCGERLLDEVPVHVGGSASQLPEEKSVWSRFLDSVMG